ncbi:MAG: hypothetical protein AB1643_03225 [Patescibacteria group bacterium]
MKFNVKYTKLGNQFFFISNLSEWHFSCRPDYNEIWIKRTGDLTRKEKQSLQDFKNIMTKYGFTYRNKKSVYIGNIFYKYPEESIWEKLRWLVTKKELEKIKEIFNIFNPRFNKIWRSYKPFGARIKIFENVLYEKRNVNLFKALEIMLGNKKKIKCINIFIIFSPHDFDATAAGGANIGDDSITLELPNFKSKNESDLEYSVGVLAHEVGHILFRNGDYHTLIKKIIRKKKIKDISNLYPRCSVLEIVEELIIELLVPIGVLAQKFYKFKPIQYLFLDLDSLGEYYLNLKKGSKIPLRKYRKYLIWQLYPLTTHYLYKNKKIDKNFLSTLFKTLSM